MSKIEGNEIFDVLQNKILEALREKFISLNADNAEKLITSRHNTKLRYYCKGYDLNLYEPLLKHKSEYEDAAGKELDWKMAALRSSSALILNTLGDGEKVKIKNSNLLGVDGGEYKLKYEQPLASVVVEEKDEIKNAYIDALLQNGKQVVLIENKMLEYIPQAPAKNKSFSSGNNYVGKSYLDDKNYVGILKNSDLAKEYRDMFIELKEMQNKTASKWDGLENYDILQIVKHSLGFLTEYLNTDKFKGIERIKLVNSIWCIDEKRRDYIFNDNKVRETYDAIIENEFHGNERYKHIFEKIKNIYDSVNLSFDFSIICWSDFKDCFDLGEERKVYLQRYDI